MSECIPTPIDLSRSVPPLPPVLGERLRATLGQLAQRNDLGSLMHLAQPGGSEFDRRQAAAWLEPRFHAALDPSRIVVTNGTQNALFLLFEGLVGQGGLLLAESLSYGVIRALAVRAHIRLMGVPIDEEGVIPEAFETLCQSERPRALYCNPTDQNPTTAIMPEARRVAIAAIARRHGIPIIEDDPLGRLHPDAPPPIAAFAPDVTWYVMGLTKCLAHGLRLAYLVGPSRLAIEAMIGPAWRLSHWYSQPLAAEVASRWIADGSADAICAAIRAECTARQDLARDILAGADIATHRSGLHLWLRLPPTQDRRDIATQLESDGVLVRPADRFSVDDAPPPNALRLSLSSPVERTQVEVGLHKLAEALA